MNEEVKFNGETVKGFEFREALGPVHLTQFGYGVVYELVSESGMDGMLDECGFYPNDDYSDAGNAADGWAVSEEQIARVQKLPFVFVVNLLVESIRFQVQECGVGQHQPADTHLNVLVAALTTILKRGSNDE